MDKVWKLVALDTVIRKDDWNYCSQLINKELFGEKNWEIC